MNEIPGHVREACHQSATVFWTGLDERLWSPLSTALAEARRAHAAAVEAAGFSAAPPEDPGDARGRVVGYLDTVAGEVLAPTLEALGRHLPARTVLKLMGDARRASRTAIGALPAEETLEEPAELGAAATDSMGRRLGKSTARLLAALRRGGGPRSVPVRPLAQRHRSLWVAPTEQRWTLATLQDWSTWLGGLERAWAAWAAAVIPAMSRTEEAADEEGPDAWGDVAAAAGALDQALAALVEVPPHAEARAAAVAEVETWSVALASDLGVGGTFLLRSATAPKEQPLVKKPEDWTQWSEQCLARLDLHRDLLAGLLTAERIRGEVARRLDEEILDQWCPPLVEAADALQALAARLGRGGQVTKPLLESLRTEAMAQLEQVRELSETAGRHQRRLGRVADAAVEDLQGQFWKLPDAIELHALPEAGERVRRPTAEGRTIRLKEIARQAFDALRMERIHDAPTTVAPAMAAAAEDAAEMEDVVRFGFGAAESELEERDRDAPERARTLATEALSRSADGVRALADAARAAVAEGEALLAADLEAGLTRLAERALAERVHGQILDVRGRVSSGLADARVRLAPRVAGWTRGARSWLARTQALGARILRRGRTLVGAQPDAAVAERTARFLARTDGMVEGLPLVYQRLFAAEPVRDAGLLAGRERELAEAEARWERWKHDDGVPLLVHGRPGSGISSFFNVFATRLEDGGARTVRRTLDERFTRDEELAAYLAELVGLGDAASMDELATAILTSPGGSVPDLVALEGLEHLYLRVPGGTDLVERLLTLMAETEPRVFWMASITSSAWQLVQKCEPTAVAQVDRLELAPLSPEGVAAAVLARHRRSGMPMSYVEPTEGRRLMRRRLRRLRGTKAHQVVLQEDFFDRLQRESLGNMRLALFQWLRSADFTTVEGELWVRPLAPLDFSFLESLDLIQNFTLKAFLEHRTLNLAEHDVIFRLPRHESYQVFESLRNRHIIEPVPGGRQEGVSEVEGTVRYRIQPLLTGAVAAHLTTRNIVH